MFTVSCNVAFLCHPAVHHSLLLLRALRQRHTLAIERMGANVTNIGGTVSLSQCGNHISIVPPNLHGSKCVTSGGSIGTVGESPLCVAEHGLQRVHDPQHILYLFSSASPVRQSALDGQIQSYLNAVVVSNQVLRAADDVLIALSIGEMEAVRQTHGNLIDCVAALDASLQQTTENEEGGGGNGATQEVDCLSTWPLFTTIQFLVEEGGLPLGPFPRMSRAYYRLKESTPVVAHSQLVWRTFELSRGPEGPTGELPAWPHRGFLRDIQRQIAEYTTDPPERIMAGVTGEKGPLRARVSGARLGLQRTPARIPWTMQGLHR
ncbi:hypothetical protein, conserved [Trypanosoma brucei gambiense DAL972]|uniref:Uncharacterized protein n=3 Tax=Trypanosoma brucei TaxID=5691 RepID=C9ZMA6_TRYB9|nr:hypothetical protein, conserved [Trypanosoma brucei gambiense DAL972]6YXX_EO Chain EO, mt-LAF15a [Trypanosoma brucei brucei]6YXX_EP Chain EP, mt-LAF15a [Trypanosoma brucei brucei]6YXY_EO Chain EO, mt-LAF15a [Trypanosoma brucei brucei]6YXY_EP Chain EP, mt-LAF15a [Trypanosoma brucei brucei]RHW72761.1 hypothetical protein DPX39_040076400 [Trypanosoma brucei equiperdum]CBH10779.1 hypothetical protein, conserved [Trypanosoma brucei gambiense DAL972]|eukprot:XP_011773067.1 hypothetical protein, conserved [Trypanosoma brucei gambiense DAL972]